MATQAERLATIAALTNEELAAALNSPLRTADYYHLLEEIDRRKKVKEAAKQAELDARPFNPRVDLSADVRWLWKKIVIWFLIVPALVGVVLWILSSATR